MNILLGSTGSVATVLLSKMIDMLADEGHRVAVVKTESCSKFPIYNPIKGYNLSKLSVYTDESEWETFEKQKRVLHIDLVNWADKFIIAPCSANSLAKIANGISDNLLTCCARAWDFNKPFILAPAMNCKMFSHPVTKEHLDKIKKWGIITVPPATKTLFCGEHGEGALADLKEIFSK